MEQLQYREKSETQNVVTIWENCIEGFRTRISEKDIERFFVPIKPMSYENGDLLLSCPTSFFKEYLEAHHKEDFRVVLSSVFENPVNVKFWIEKKIISGESKKEKSFLSFNNKDEIENKEEVLWDNKLCKKYTFSSFKEGESNKIAMLIAQQVSKKPGEESMNPFFIFGKPGVGKTHLMTAVGWGILENYPQKRVFYVETHDFINQYVSAARFHKVVDLMGFYQQVDVLLIDDFQVLEGKEKTQEAFFEIFNYLRRLGKQIIITCDRSPSELSGVHERIISRMKGALNIEMLKPDLELKRKILEEKLRQENVDLPEVVKDFIVNNVNGCVREFLGIIATLFAESAVENKEVTLEGAKRVLKRVSGFEEKEIDLSHIINVICKYYSLKEDDIKGESRRQDIARARQLVMFFSKKMTKNSLSVIGSFLGGKKHTTVMHACKVIEDLISLDKIFLDQVSSIECLIKTAV